MTDLATDTQVMYGQIVLRCLPRPAGMAALLDDLIDIMLVAITGLALTRPIRPVQHTPSAEHRSALLAPCPSFNRMAKNEGIPVEITMLQQKEEICFEYKEIC